MMTFVALLTEILILQFLDNILGHSDVHLYIEHEDESELCSASSLN